MRKPCIVWTVCILAIGSSACTTMKPSASHLDTAKACADWRWIGISQPGTRCPVVAGWTVRPMFPQLPPAPPPEGAFCGALEAESYRRKIDAVRELNRFCVYEIENPRKNLKNLALPSSASAGLVRFDQDCAALSLTASELDETWKPGAENFLTQVGRPGEPLAMENRPSVRLAFLDTQPDGEGAPEVPGNSLHGYTLAHIARQMTCNAGGQERCAARITTRLALPIIEFDATNPERNRIDLEKGGYLGMQSDLAQAIVDEVIRWQEEKSEQHLVLNLSMAWDGDLFGGLDKQQIRDLKAGTQAVYDALAYAAASDVLVLAAAGNLKQDPCENSGPLLPAAWESEPPLDSCSQRKDPLLYAVGGLRSDDRRLDNSRPGGMPRRVAYGEAVIFSGSSVATAVASSIAAVVWNAFPTLSSHGLMDILDQSGDALFPADFWFPRPRDFSSRMAHKLTLCTALARACDENDANDPDPEICALGCGSSEASGDLSKLLQTPGEKTLWKGSCQPWLFPQPEDPIRLCSPPGGEGCSGGGPHRF